MIINVLIPEENGDIKNTELKPDSPSRTIEEHPYAAS